MAMKLTFISFDFDQYDDLSHALVGQARNHIPNLSADGIHIIETSTLHGTDSHNAEWRTICLSSEHS